MKRKDNLLYYAFDVDDNGKLRTMLWVHGRSTLDYKDFGDVISFDSTYRTNIYGMPFAPFVGVNHHKQSILLGGALMTDETTNSYTWVFERWLECMEGKQPISIITDQDLAMKAAISKVMPTTKHRYCIWHIMRKFREKVNAKQHLMFRKCVNKSKGVVDFVENWQHIIESEGFEKNEWLKGLFREREHWVPVYLKGTFFAGMSSTQCGESMNSFFKGYLDQRKNLKEFVEGYDEAYQARVYTETEESTRNINSTIPLRTTWPLEHHAATCYTNAIFIEFQDQVMERSSFYLKVILQDERYKVFDIIGFNEEQSSSTIHLDLITNEMFCSCEKFQFKGWACSHMLRVMEDMGLRELPDHYILSRWTRAQKSAYGYRTSIVQAIETFTCSKTVRELDLRKLLEQFIEMAIEDERTYQTIRGWIKDKITALSEGKQKSNMYDENNSNGLKETPIMNGCNDINIDYDSSLQIYNPELRRRKGRPTIKHRIQSSIEIVKRQKRACKRCNELGHNIRTCLRREQKTDEEKDSADSEGI